MIPKSYIKFPDVKARYGLVIQGKDDKYTWCPCRSDYIDWILSRFDSSNFTRGYIGWMNRWFTSKKFLSIISDKEFLKNKEACLLKEISYNCR